MADPLLSVGDRLAGEVAGLREEARRERRFYQWAFIVLAAVLLALLAIGSQNFRNGEQIKDANHVIKDCITPGGDCYERGQARTAEVIGQLVRAHIYVAQCYRTTDTAAAIETCVTEKLQATP